MERIVFAVQVTVATAPEVVRRDVPEMKTRFAEETEATQSTERTFLVSFLKIFIIFKSIIVRLILSSLRNLEKYGNVLSKQ
jgi:hypothetical protein